MVHIVVLDVVCEVLCPSELTHEHLVLCICSFKFPLFWPFDVLGLRNISL